MHGNLANIPKLSIAKSLKQNYKMDKQYNEVLWNHTHWMTGSFKMSSTNTFVCAFHEFWYRINTNVLKNSIYYFFFHLCFCVNLMTPWLLWRHNEFIMASDDKNMHWFVWCSEALRATQYVRPLSSTHSPQDLTQPCSLFMHLIPEYMAISIFNSLILHVRHCSDWERTQIKEFTLAKHPP